MKTVTIASLAALLLTATAWAADIELRAVTIAGGGGAAAGGPYTASLTIGQPIQGVVAASGYVAHVGFQPVIQAVGGGSPGGDLVCIDFAQGLPAGTTPAGTTPPYVAGGVLHLTDATNDQANYYTTPIPRQIVQSANARWQSLIGGGTTPGADGMSFNLGYNLGTAFIPEEGAVNGLSVTIDTWENTSQEVGLEIKWNGQRIGFTRVGDGTTAAQAPLRPNQFRDTALSVTPSGWVTFSYAGFSVSGQIPSYTGIDVNQYVFAARTGGANDRHWIDNLCIQLEPQPRPELNVAIQELPAAGALGQPLSYVVAVNNAGPGAASNLTVVVAHQGALLAGPVAMSSHGGCTVVSNEVRCALGVLVGGQSATLRITVTPGLQESLRIVARSSAVLDGNVLQDSEAGWIPIGGFVTPDCFCSCATDTTPLTVGPVLGSWFTEGARQYARLRNMAGGVLRSEWTGGSVGFYTRGVSNVYADIQKIDYSANYVYVTSSGLPSHVMGPWECELGGVFPNTPLDIHAITRIPLNPIVNSGHPVTPLGAMGVWVNGTAIYNMLDAFYYDGVEDVSSPDLWETLPTGETRLNGYWHRNAYFAEKSIFDPAEYHPEQDGEYHSHAGPLHLRAQLDDNVLWDTLPNGEISNVREKSGDFHHSPILGWAYDGHPIYGPYGYSDPLDTNSSIQRMRSGYVLRDGQYGTTDLYDAGRTILPRWTLCMQGRTRLLLTGENHGPEPSELIDNAANPCYGISWDLGRYVEDYAFLGDLGSASSLGIEWDLDRYNGRCCKTPEFPNGVYAYFLSLDADGVPAFPYVIGWQYCSETNGGVVSAISETTTSYFQNTDVPVILSGPTFSGMAGSREIGLIWSSLEGGTYRVDTTDDFATWTALTPSVTATGGTAEFTYPRPNPLPAYTFYRVVMEALAPYDMHLDPTSGFTYRWPSSAAPGSTVTVKILLSDPAPSGTPLGAAIGNVMADSVSRTDNTITATFTIPSGMSGTFALAVGLPGPTTLTLNDGFTVK